MVNYQTITTRLNQIPADTWEVLGEIKERRPAMMISELIDCRGRALKQQEPPEPPSLHSGSSEPRRRSNGGMRSQLREHASGTAG